MATRSEQDVEPTATKDTRKTAQDREPDEQGLLGPPASRGTGGGSTPGEVAQAESQLESDLAGQVGERLDDHAAGRRPGERLDSGDGDASDPNLARSELFDQVASARPDLDAGLGADGSFESSTDAAAPASRVVSSELDPARGTDGTDPAGAGFDPRPDSAADAADAATSRLPGYGADSSDPPPGMDHLKPSFGPTVNLQEVQDDVAELGRPAARTAEGPPQSPFYDRLGDKIWVDQPKEYGPEPPPKEKKEEKKDEEKKDKDEKQQEQKKEEQEKEEQEKAEQDQQDAGPAPEHGPDPADPSTPDPDAMPLSPRLAALRDALVDDLGAARVDPSGGNIDPADDTHGGAEGFAGTSLRGSASTDDLAQFDPDAPTGGGHTAVDTARGSTGTFGSGAIDHGPDHVDVQTDGAWVDTDVPDLDAMRDQESDVSYLGVDSVDTSDDEADDAFVE